MVRSFLWLITKIKCQVDVQLSFSFNKFEYMFGQPNHQPVCYCGLSYERLISFILVVWSKRQLVHTFTFRITSRGHLFQVQWEGSRLQKLIIFSSTFIVTYLDKLVGVGNWQAKIITLAFTELVTPNLLTFPTIAHSLDLLFVSPQPWTFSRKHSPLAPT